MEENIVDALRYLEVFSIMGAGAGAWYFGLKQTQINKRLKDLQDYVAVNIAGLFGSAELGIYNVGKINVYLHKYEIGSNTGNFPKPVLIAHGNDNVRFSIRIKQYSPLETMSVKLYLSDEDKRKFIMEGEVLVESVSVPPQSVMQNIPAPTHGVQQVQTMTRAWAYKTYSSNWAL